MNSSDSNNSDNFNQDDFLNQNREEVDKEFQTESAKALADLKKAAVAIVKNTVSEYQQLGFIRDVADDLHLGNQPDDALR